MMTTPFSTRTLLALAVSVLAGATLASCAPQYSGPEQVQSSTPKVSYKYHNDTELAQANQNASAFCSQYQSIPRTLNFSSDPDGSSKTVMFECMKPLPQYVPQMSQPVPMPNFNHNMTYTYMTDQEFTDAARTAQTYCMNSGYQQVVTSTITNPNGSRTVSFQCSPR